MARADVEHCDFCSAPGPRWTFKVIPGTGTDWGACDVCKELILAGDKEAVLKRSSLTAPAGMIPAAMRRQVLDQMRTLHAHFWATLLPGVVDDGVNYDGETQHG